MGEAHGVGGRPDEGSRRRPCVRVESRAAPSQALAAPHTRPVRDRQGHRALSATRGGRGAMAREAPGHPTFGLLFGKESRIAFLIRLFSTFRGERPSITNHTFLVRPDGELIVESIPTGTSERSWRQVYDNDRHWGVLVEPRDLSSEARAVIESKAQDYLGRRYGGVAVVTHLLDGTPGRLFGADVYLFRRIRFPGMEAAPLYNICSWLICWTHRHVGWSFHGRDGALPCHRATPDDLWDDVFERRPKSYSVRAELGTRPPDVPQAYLDKIDRRRSPRCRLTALILARREDGDQSTRQSDSRSNPIHAAIRREGAHGSCTRGERHRVF